MSNQIVGLMTMLKETKPAEIVDLEPVKDKFIQLHNNIHGNGKGEMIYHKEVFNFKKILSEKPELRECTGLSLYGVFLDINVNGHTLEQGSKPDCYIIAKSFEVGKDERGKKVYEKRATLAISPYGELKLRMRSGQIKYADNPIIVYDCDTFKIGLNDKGKQVVKAYEKTLPRPDNAKIIASFIRIERHDGSFEMPYLDLDDIQRLKGYSERQNSKWDDNLKKKVPGNANALYTSNNGQIDTGFLAAKTIKHAFSSYPKVPTGKFSQLEDDNTPSPVDYGIDPDAYAAGSTEDITHEDVTDEDNQAPDDFEAALRAETASEPVETKVMAPAEDDEPEF